MYHSPKVSAGLIGFMIRLSTNNPQFMKGFIHINPAAYAACRYEKNRDLRRGFWWCLWIKRLVRRRQGVFRVLSGCLQSFFIMPCGFACVVIVAVTGFYMWRVSVRHIRDRIPQPLVAGPVIDRRRQICRDRYRSIVRCFRYRP